MVSLPLPSVSKRLDTPVERLRRRVALRLDAEKHKPIAFRKTQVTLADHIGVTKQTLNEMLFGKSATQGALARLDLIAEHLETSAVELVQPYDATTMSLNAQEQSVIAFYRSWPEVVRGQVLMLLRYFGELLPEEVHARGLLLELRRVDADEMPLVQEAIRQAVQNTLHKQRRGRATSRGAARRSGETVGATGTHHAPSK